MAGIIGSRELTLSSLKRRCNMRKTLSLVIVGLIITMVLGAVLCSAREKKAVKPEEFYRGARIVLIVPFKPGGGFDAYSRILSPFLARTLGAKDVVVANKPGGGGYRGANWLYLQAPRDGKTLGFINGQTMVVNELFGVAKVAKFKSTKEFSIIAAWSGTPLGILINSKLPYNSLQELRGAKGLKGGTTDPLGTHAISDAVVAEAVDLQDFRIIAGYSSSSELIAAVMRGELDLYASSYETCKKYVDQGFAKIVGVISTKRVPLFPDVPTIYELGMRPEANKWVEIATTTRSLLRLLAAPPGTPGDRVKFLSDAFWKVIKSKDFQKELEKRQRLIHLPADMKEATARIDKVLGMSEKDKKEFRYLVEKKYR